MGIVSDFTMNRSGRTAEEAEYLSRPFDCIAILVHWNNRKTSTWEGGYPRTAAGRKLAITTAKSYLKRIPNIAFVEVYDMGRSGATNELELLWEGENR